MYLDFPFLSACFFNCSSLISRLMVACVTRKPDSCRRFPSSSCVSISYSPINSNILFCLTRFIKNSVPKPQLINYGLVCSAFYQKSWHHLTEPYQKFLLLFQSIQHHLSIPSKASVRRLESQPHPDSFPLSFQLLS